ncbi:MAG: cryptic autophosphorylating protein tyrosine kinase Etk [Pelotomaculum sp. PtaB.Bin104]|nr:MAG: cryptic autophosphorylating protein tyrosine kinase Etk [Pelotomaculum sp. PtaB.Bin104]
MEDEINLRELFTVIWNHRVTIISVFLVSVISAIIYCFFISPIYLIEGEIELGTFPDKTFTSQSAAKEILLSDKLLQNVIDQLNLSSDIDSFKGKLKIEPVKDTNFLKVTLLTSDKIEGIKIVEKVMELFVDQGNLSYQKHKELFDNPLEVMQARLKTIEKDIEQTREVLASIENAQSIPSVEKDFRRSKTLEYLQSEESERVKLLEQVLNLQKELSNLKNIQIVEKPREPKNPVKPKRMSIITTVGFLSLIIGVCGVLFLNCFSRNPFNPNKCEK